VRQRTNVDRVAAARHRRVSRPRVWRGDLPRTGMRAPASTMPASRARPPGRPAISFHGRAVARAGAVPP